MSDQTPDNQIKIPDARQPLVFFIIVTSIFFFLSYGGAKVPPDKLFTAYEGPDFEGESQKDYFPNPDTKNLVTLLIYIGILIIGNYFININISSEICGSPNWSSTFIVTLLPWSLIFVILLFLLRLVPSWLAPFSNTIGYFVANICGLEKFMEKILKPTTEVQQGQPTGDNAHNIDIITSNLEHIYSDKSLLINEITLENFHNFYKRFYLGELFNKTYIEKAAEEQQYVPNTLYNFIILKDQISEFIWYFLTGLLVCSVSYNYIANDSCKSNIKQMEDNHNAYLKLQEQIQKSKANAPTYQIG